MYTFSAYVSMIKPKNIKEALRSQLDHGHALWTDSVWSKKVWHLVPWPRNRDVIWTRWIFRNKLCKQGQVTRNKYRLVVQRYNQEEWIKYDEHSLP